MVRIPTQPGSSEVYVLHGVDVAGGRVIAKGGPHENIKREHFVYTDLLPSLSLTHPQAYWLVDGSPGSPSWLFMEFIEGSLYDEADQNHRELASRWLAYFHLQTSKMDLRSKFPVVGPSRYLFYLRRGREWISDSFDNEYLDSGAKQLLRKVIAHCDELEAQWTRIEQLCRQMPACLVHGDFIAKNVHVQSNGRGRLLLYVLDWEASGWGPPIEDLAGIDVDVYTKTLEKAGHTFDSSVIRSMATIGSMFRALAFIQVESDALRSKWVSDAVAALGQHEADLAIARKALDLS